MPLGSFRLNGLSRLLATGRTAKAVTASGNAQISTAQSQFGGASALFDGTSDYLTVTGTGFNWGTGDFTVEAWVRHVAINDQQVYWDFRTGSTNHHIFYITSGNKLEYYDGSTYTGTTSLAANTWYHLAVSRSSGTLKIFINGTQEISTSNSGNHSSVGPMVISSDQTFLSTNSVNGYMDEVRVSNIARYTTGFTAPAAAFTNDANTLLLLHCNGTNATTLFVDDNGVRSSKGITALGNAQVSTAQNKFGGASALFDGTGDYLSVATDADFGFGTGDFTIEGWFYKTTATTQWFIDTRTTTTQNSVAVQSNGSGSLRLFVNGAFVLTSSNTHTNNAWNHLAISRASGVTRFFINGVVSTNTYTDATDYGSTKPLVIGAQFNGTTAFNGYVDEFRVTKGLARYTTTFTPSTTAFVNDANTVLLLHIDGTNASTTFEDDNGVRAKRNGIRRGTGYIATAQSKFSGASYFNNSTAESSSNCIEVASTHNSAFSFTGNFTIEGWYRATNFNSINALAGNWQYGFYFSIWSNNRVKFEMTSSGGGSGVTLDITGISPTFATNTWYHMAVVRNGSTVTVYRDGVSLGSSSHTIVCDDFLTIGANTNNNSPTQGWPGYIDEFRISNTARYTSEFTPSTTPFVNDENTLLLMHCDGANNSTTFTDDNA